VVKPIPDQESSSEHAEGSEWVSLYGETY
jgi:hypothetical protein